jgi:predicted SnoaL-like aldol condensation-catalyzing enzyme
MNSRDPKLTSLLFNEAINRQDVDSLSALMTEDHTFIDREGKVGRPKSSMIDGWRRFFGMFPAYKNTFTRIESQGELVVIVGHAFWTDQQPYDPVIWTARIENDLVAEWRVYDDSEEIRKSLQIT